MMDLNSGVDDRMGVNVDGRTYGRTYGQTNGQKTGSIYRAMPEAGATIMKCYAPKPMTSYIYSGSNYDVITK